MNNIAPDRNAYRAATCALVWVPLLAVALYNVGVEWWVARSATAGAWLEEKEAKGYLLQARGPHDYVLIGSSRAQNQINSRTLAQQGVSLFNYGVAGRDWQEWPYNLRRALPYARVGVVLSLNSAFLYQPPSCPADYTLTDVYFYLARFSQLACWQQMTRSQLLKVLPMNRYRTFWQAYRSGQSPQALLDIEQRYGIRINEDERGFDYVRGRPSRYVVLYRNGDGQVFSRRGDNISPEERQPNNSRKPFDPVALAYLQQLVAQVQRSGKRAILLVEPNSRFDPTVVDVKALRERLGPTVRVLAPPRHLFGPLHWADEMHLSIEGTQLYSGFLAQALSQEHPPAQKPLQEHSP